MKCSYTSANGRLSFEVEADTQKALFGKIAELQGVFEADAHCGCCGSDDLYFRVRPAESRATGAKCFYYEMNCHACSARLDFGQHQEGDTLYPKRKDRNEKDMPSRGWYVWIASDNAPEPKQQSPSSKPQERPTMPQGRPGMPAKPAQVNGNGKRPLTIEEKHTGLLKAYAEAQAEDRIQSLMEWARDQRFNPHQEEEQTGAYYAAMERLSLAKSPINAGMAEESIPF